MGLVTGGKVYWSFRQVDPLYDHKKNDNCPEPHETAQRKKPNCDVIYKIKKRIWCLY